MSASNRVRSVLRAEVLVSVAAGAVFAVGLALAGMTQPSKVVGFLDFAGSWDPSLALVMVGAIAVYSVLHRRVASMEAPILGGDFSLPTKTDLEPRLVLGAALFGVGWGLGGFCPGPALASLGTAKTEVLTFVAAMLAGMYAFTVLERARARRKAASATDG